VQLPNEVTFVHLAYLDDTGTRDKKAEFQVMAALIVKDTKFRHLEIRSGAIAGMEVQTIIPPEKWDQFEEFHAWELYGGFGTFEGVDQEKRFKVIDLLLKGIKQVDASIVYGAVNKSLLAQQLYSSADPLDICFKICVKGIEDFIGKIEPPDLALLIVDDTTDKELKKSLRASFRKLRNRLIYPIYSPHTAWHLHDDMYFGDSKESIGIQTVDLCAYFIGHHLKGDDPAAEGFYKLIEEQIVHSKIEPEG